MDFYSLSLSHMGFEWVCVYIGYRYVIDGGRDLNGGRDLQNWGIGVLWFTMTALSPSFSWLLYYCVYRCMYIYMNIYTLNYSPLCCFHCSSGLAPSFPNLYRSPFLSLEFLTTMLSHTTVYTSVCPFRKTRFSTRIKYYLIW